MIYSLSVSCNPLTANQAYPDNGRGRRTLSKEGRQYKNFIRLNTMEQIKDFEVHKGKVLRALYIFCKPEFITMKGEASLSAGDADGMIKLFQDSICASLKVNDALVWDTRVLKIYQECPRVFAELQWVSLEDYMSPYRFLNLPLGNMNSKESLPKIGKKRELRPKLGASPTFEPF